MVWKITNIPKEDKIVIIIIFSYYYGNKQYMNKHKRF